MFFFFRWICILCQFYPNNKVKKKKVFDFHLNSFLLISSSSQLKILSIYTHSFLVYYSFFYLPYKYLLYSSLLLSTLPTTLQVFFFFFLIIKNWIDFVYLLPFYYILYDFYQQVLLKCWNSMFLLRIMLKI